MKADPAAPPSPVYQTARQPLCRHLHHQQGHRRAHIAAKLAAGLTSHDRVDRSPSVVFHASQMLINKHDSKCPMIPFAQLVCQGHQALSSIAVCTQDCAINMNPFYRYSTHSNQGNKKEQHVFPEMQWYEHRRTKFNLHQSWNKNMSPGPAFSKLKMKTQLIGQCSNLPEAVVLRCSN